MLKLSDVAPPKIDFHQIERFGWVAIVRGEVANSFVLKSLRVHPAYGFPVEANIDSDKAEDQGWGFTISDFKLTARTNSGT